MKLQWIGAECIQCFLYNNMYHKPLVLFYEHNLYIGFLRPQLKDMLRDFDAMWADFEFRYVGLMCNVKSERQYYHQQDVIVLFCESTLR